MSIHTLGPLQPPSRSKGALRAAGSRPRVRSGPASLQRVVLLAAATWSAMPATAGGLFLYEFGTAEVGLASAGYFARAPDATTVFTNPAGMIRLEGDQLTLGLQALYGRANFSVDPAGTSPGLGTNGGGNAIGWFPGGGAFYSHSVSPDLKVGLALTGNFGLSIKYNLKFPDFITRPAA